MVRRVDDLGRIVIPKEIRRTMEVEKGQPLEGICWQRQYYSEEICPRMCVLRVN